MIRFSKNLGTNMALFCTTTKALKKYFKSMWGDIKNLDHDFLL